MTTAILEIFRHNFQKAVDLNPMSPIVIGLISIIFFNEIYLLMKKKRSSPHKIIIKRL